MQIFRRMIVAAVISLITVCICILTISFSNAQVSASSNECSVGIYNINTSGDSAGEYLGCITPTKYSQLNQEKNTRTIRGEKWFEVKNINALVSGWVKVMKVKKMN